MEWNEFFDTGKADADSVLQVSEDEKTGFFRRLREGMSKTREAIGGEIRATVFQDLDDETWEALEEALIYADVGAKTTAKIVARLEQQVESGAIENGEQLSAALRSEVEQITNEQRPRIDISQKPAVIFVVGVNGTGKTTTVGKLAWHLQKELGLSVILGAADTFRAAAIEQLEIWAERAGCEIVKGQPGSDPGAVAFDAVEAAKARGHDVAIIDTAGRLHTEVNLMEELAKVQGVISGQIEGAPYETLLVVDATTGQNGLRQAQLFSESVDVTGVCLTKLDGTAKGGIALAICDELGLSIKLIGVGESVEDLRPFDGQQFAEALI